jgi:hypothetical protein
MLVALFVAIPIAVVYQSATAVGSDGDAKAAASTNGGMGTALTVNDTTKVTRNASQIIGTWSPVVSFEGGLRYKAGTYDVVVLNGSYKEMGRQYGALMKNELQSVYGLITDITSKRGYTIEQVREMGSKLCAYQPERMKAIYAGMAETSGLTKEDAEALYYGIVLILVLPNTTQASCSFLAAWGNYTPDGTLVVSRNWDLMDLVSVFDPYYVLVIYNPTDGSNSVATLGQAGMRPETLMNSAGLFIADDNHGGSGGSLAFDNRPELISQFFRFMLDYSTLEQLDAGIMSTRTDYPWIVNTAGPEKAYSYEENVYDLRRREGSDVIAATNHFVDPSWHIDQSPDANSVVRYTNLLNLSMKNKGDIDAARMMKIRDVLIQDGGATFLHYEMGGLNFSTDHQVVFVPKTGVFWMKTAGRAWQGVDLKSLFS